MKKFIVITSIFNPTEAIKKFSQIKDWQLVVVGDQKTPPEWKYPGVIYLSPQEQEKLNFDFINYLPWNHYCRKMIGYLYAIQEGADIIADSDDDNIPYDCWSVDDFQGRFQTIQSDKNYVNVYTYFTAAKIWPRGYPLKLINENIRVKESSSEHNIGVWQYLADKDPDVDAIYRLVIGKEVMFEKRNPIVLDTGTVSPFNSQNTVFRKELFPLLYLPAFVTFRFTDILRGLVAQPIMWQHNYKLGFGQATVYQERNDHDFLRDFESELPVYLDAESVPNLVASSIQSAATIEECLLSAYQELHKKNIVNSKEIELLRFWLSAIKRLMR